MTDAGKWSISASPRRTETFSHDKAHKPTGSFSDAAGHRDRCGVQSPFLGMAPKSKTKSESSLVVT